MPYFDRSRLINKRLVFSFIFLGDYFLHGSQLLCICKWNLDCYIFAKGFGLIWYDSFTNSMPFFFCQTKKYFKEIGVHADVKYIDPTYMIRACRANASDGILCTVLGQNAVSLPLSLNLSISFIS